MATRRKVALLCLDPLRVQRVEQPFNYAVRRVQAHLIASNLDGLEVHLVESRVPDVDEFVARVEEINPDVVGVSAYVWSFLPLLDVAREIKRRRPDTLIVFGGPSARPSMFALAPYVERRRDVDALVLGEGEEVFVDIVKLQDRVFESLSRLPGLALPTSTGWHHTKPAVPLEALDTLASPYALGLHQANISAHIESYRGCPLSCSFCQWGDSKGNSRIFSADYLQRDFEIMLESGIRRATIVDAALNLNPRAFRNFAKAARATGAVKDIALAFEVYPSHLTDEHLDFMAECHHPVEIGLGLQSYDKNVLRQLQRPFDEKRFENVARTLHDLGCLVAIEIIMGLPGDNPDSFLRTLERARSLPCEVRVFHCLALPDALMDRAPPWADMDFDPVTLKMRSCAGWTAKDMDRMVARLDEMHQIDTFGEKAWAWQLASNVTSVAPTRTLRTGRAGEAISPASPSSQPPPEWFAAAIAEATNFRWSVHSIARSSSDVLHITFETAPSTKLVVELQHATQTKKAYRFIDDIAVSYRPGASMQPDFFAVLDHLIATAPNALRNLYFEKPDNRRSLPLLKL